jgi:hypothetical protein
MSNLKVLRKGQIGYLKYAIIVIGALAFNLAVWSTLYAQINNPGLFQSGAVVAGHVATWGPGAGQLQDGGAVSQFQPGGTNGQVQFNNSGLFGGFTVGGDGTLNTGTGSLIVTKTNGVAFAASATTDTTNAANVGSGTLALARLSLATSHLYVGSAGGNPADVALSGDATMAVTGAITVTKTSGVAFAPSATTDTTNATNISSGTLAAARGGAGTITGALRGNGAGVVTQAACADLSNGAASCSTDTTNAANISSGTLPVARLAGLNNTSNTLGADVNLNNTANFFDGPSIAQGATGTWFACGTITVTDTAGAASVFAKLWDGTSTPVATSANTVNSANQIYPITLCGVITSPVGNIRISARDSSSVSGKIKASDGVGSQDSTIFAFRIN